MTLPLWSHCSDWLGYRFGPGSYRNSSEAPKSCPHFPTPGLFCDRGAAVCLVVLWTLWPTTTLGFFFFRSLFFFLSLSLAWGDRKPQRPQSLLLLFYISLLVTGLTSPQGTRGTLKGEKRVGGIKRGNRFKGKKRLKRDGKQNYIQR